MSTNKQSSSLSQAEISELLFSLIEKGKENGILTADDLANFNSLNLSSEIKQAFYETLSNNDIEFERLEPSGTFFGDDIEGEEDTLPINFDAFKDVYETDELSEDDLLNAEKNIGDFCSKDSRAIYMAEIKQYPLLTPEEEQAVTKKAAEGDESAKELLIHSNLRLVVSIAKRYSSTASTMSFEDLIQEGNIGLITATRKFNPELGYRFSTYSTYWIKQNILRAITNQDKEIRMPTYLYNRVSKVVQFLKTSYSNTGKRPTIKEISENTGFSEKQVKEYLQIYSNYGQPIHLDTPIKGSSSSNNDDRNATIGELIPNKDEYGNPECYEKVELAQNMFRIISTLNSREQIIILLRYGFIDGITHTLDEVGSELGLTRERVRQLQSLAELKILRRGKGIY